MLLALAACALAQVSLPGGGPLDATITSGVLFNDTDGHPLHAHGAGLYMPVNDPELAGKIFMVGTTQKLPPHWLSKGVNLYWSYDLENWHFEAEIFRTSQVVGITGDVRLERPKLLYNVRTKMYVMWFHLDDASFSHGYVGVATSPTIGGPYDFKAGWRPDGQRSLDMTLFSFSRGTVAEEAFLVRSVDNQFVGFSRLTDDFLNTTSEGILSRGPRCEGVSLWSEGVDAARRVYLLCSHLTGWHANPAILAVSSDAGITRMTNWTVLGNPTHKAFSYDSQSTYVCAMDFGAAIGVRGRSDGRLGSDSGGGTNASFQRALVGGGARAHGGRLRLYMGDRWNEGSESAPGSVGGASYVWLPMISNASDPTGWSMPLLKGKWNGTGRWRVADYLSPLDA